MSYMITIWPPSRYQDVFMICGIASFSQVSPDTIVPLSPPSLSRSGTTKLKSAAWGEERSWSSEAEVRQVRALGCEIAEVREDVVLDVVVPGEEVARVVVTARKHRPGSRHAS